MLDFLLCGPRADGIRVESEAIDIIYERVAGLDVHKAMIAACARIMAGAKIERTSRTFETTTQGLLDLPAWLSERGCSHVAMQATGVDWKPLWNLPGDGKFERIVANARHIKNVPGRKTDMNDALWIAGCGRRLTAHGPASWSNVLACGLIRPSFVPHDSQQDLRSLLRTRHVQRIQKTLQEADIKLDPVISDIMGISGRRMIEVMIDGMRSPRTLAGLADKRIKASPKAL